MVMCMRRITAFILIASMLASTLFMVESAFAEASQPSVPQFTVKLVDRSYDVETSYSTNPYTGETITNPGYHVKNFTIDVTIKNQPFTPITVSDGNTTGLYYNVQAKSQYENWSSSISSDGHNKYAVKASTSEYTVVTFIVGSEGWYLYDGTEVSVRVQAVTGYSYNVWSMGGGILPIGTQFKLLTASDWSNIQTITYGSPAQINTPAPTNQPVQPPPTANSTTEPTQTPTEPVQPDTQSDVLLGFTWEHVALAVACAVIAVLVVALVLSRRRRP